MGCAAERVSQRNSSRNGQKPGAFWMRQWRMKPRLEADHDPGRSDATSTAPERSYPAEKARGGEIILNTPLKRGLFVAGLAGGVALALVLSFAR